MSSVGERGIITAELTIEGHAAVNPAGRALVIRTRTGAWIVPFVSFRRVACGEEARAAVFGVVGEGEAREGSLGTYLKNSTL